MKSLLLLSTVLAFGSCSVIDCTEGSGAESTRTYETGSFESFDLSSSADVELIPSSENKVVITTYNNIHDKLEVKNEAGEVEVDFKGCINLDKTMKVKVYCSKLKAVELSGSGNIVAMDTIRGESFNISIQGSGDAMILANVNNLEADIMGSGDIMLKGSANNFKGKINGSGDIKAVGLTSKTASIHINGSGDADLGDCGNLSTSVNGSGNVNTHGK